MGQRLHGSAKTTHAIRASIQRSKASITALATQYDLNPKTVAKWKKRNVVDDARMGPKQQRSSALSTEEEAVIVAFRQHGISRLPSLEGDKPKKRFKAYPIGYLHIDIAEVRTEEGKLYMLVAIDRVCKYAFAELHERATRRVAANFLRRLIELVPYKIHTVLTDNGTHFTSPGNKCSAAKELKDMMERGELFRAHSFEYACAQNDIDHRLTKPNHPWSDEDQKTIRGAVFPRNGQVERMNRTIKETTVRRYHYENHDRLRAHLKTFLDAYNFAKRLKALKGLTPFEAICKTWTEQPKRFRINPTHHTVGLNS